MMTERDATRLWHKLFRGQEITSLTLIEAENVLADLPPESPLRLRLSTELQEIRDRHPSQ